MVIQEDLWEKATHMKQTGLHPYCSSSLSRPFMVDMSKCDLEKWSDAGWSTIGLFKMAMGNANGQWENMVSASMNGWYSGEITRVLEGISYWWRIFLWNISSVNLLKIIQSSIPNLRANSVFLRFLFTSFHHGFHRFPSPRDATECHGPDTSRQLEEVVGPRRAAILSWLLISIENSGDVWML